MAKRRKRRTVSPFLVIGLISAVVILVMGFLIINRNSGLFGPAITETAGASTQTTGDQEETLPLVTSPGQTSDETETPVTTTDGGQTPGTLPPVTAPGGTTAKPVQPTVAPATPVPTNAPATPTPTTPAPTTVATTAPTQAGPSVVQLPSYFGRILPENEPYIIREATAELFAGVYSGTMTVTQAGLGNLQLGSYDLMRIQNIVAEAGQSRQVDASLSNGTLRIVAQGSALASSDGVLRTIPLAISNGESSHSGVASFVPGASASLKVYFLAESISYVYAERVNLDGDTLAWLEVRVDLYKTG